MELRLLSVTPNAKELIFAAGRQCYTDGWIGDAWEEDSFGVVVRDLKDGHACSEKEITRLVTYLKESGHTSVLEHAKFTFAIDGVSRALTHQLVRHRLASYSQQSQRYVNLAVEFNIDDFVVPPKISKNSEAYLLYTQLMRDIQSTYNILVDGGIEPEDARYVLPNAAKTRIVLTMNCVALLHFFGLRCCTLAQWEIRDLANKMLAVCKEQLPCVFNETGSRCISLGYCPENYKRSCGKYPTKAQVILKEV
jgi:thymidylate synthase (FAD)